MPQLLVAVVRRGQGVRDLAAERVAIAPPQAMNRRLHGGGRHAERPGGLGVRAGRVVRGEVRLETIEEALLPGDPEFRPEALQ